jgi:hypothetical protein
LRLADGRRAFFKGTSPASDQFPIEALKSELRIYRELRGVIELWAPAYITDFAVDGWQALLLEDLGPKSAPPWTPALARRIMRAYAPFHAETIGQPAPAGLAQLDDWFSEESGSWNWSFGRNDVQQLADLAGTRSAEALRWLEAAIPILRQAAASLVDPRWPHALLHFDTRSDNLRWRQGRLYLLDWPHARMGPPEFDFVAFAQSIAAEGGPQPETLIEWYRERGVLREGALDASVASVASYFAFRSWAPALPSLPRIRTWQRQQLQVTLAWAARRLSLPPPDWLDALHL